MQYGDPAGPHLQEPDQGRGSAAPAGQGRADSLDQRVIDSAIRE